ncbi:MAG: N-acetylneuraminate synthase [Rhodospirillaceae bacterium]|nr:N-acetylneuraminate synthase [Rhodospirillaceae bacterium]MBT5194918.1 N-acetylneuraminate synthase [Rhodospirillaceae bacterium]MBT5896595.1 N-acetylneuraminate synthase [Rhodospirillaceae bacterium]MBT6426116.1 N-acetylneuraminate synthase [Rhodospirillaceae bacterium]MBT7760729.1 N-acetylneuraminate synthase [Rhodospirillaceae bacterium]
MSTIKIGDRVVGDGAPALLIAEVGQAHDGSLGTAHAFIDAAAEAGADAIKFQTHIAAAESTLDEEFRVKFSKQDATRYDYWHRMEFSPEQWVGLADHAKEKGLIFLSSAFSVAAVDLLDGLGHPAWKIGSGEYKSTDLMAAMAATGKPILLSTGMSRWAEIAESAVGIRALGVDLGLFQCTSRYPTPLDQVGLNVIDKLRAAHDCPAGLSDHSGSPYPALAALARGADMIEVHVTFDKRLFGPDVPASLTFEEFRQVADGRAAFATMDAHPVDKDVVADELGTMRGLFTKSLAPTRALAKGTVLAADMLTAKKPGTGISATRMDEYIGRTLADDVQPDRLLRPDDVK